MTEGEKLGIYRIAREVERGDWSELNEERLLDMKLVIKVALAHVGPQFNAGTQCDMLTGPCACGAWH